MLDNLRDQSSFEEEELPPDADAPKPKVKKPRRSIDQITGMNAKQRFFLAIMLLIMICLMGMMFLLITEKIVPPFM